jgi:TolB protein
MTWKHLVTAAAVVALAGILLMPRAGRAEEPAAAKKDDAPAAAPQTAAPTHEPLMPIEEPSRAPLPIPADPRETHFVNVRQLTFGGENAEAYFDATGRRLIFQSTRDGHGCDAIYTMTAEGKDVRMVSSGKGRCTCSYYFPSGKRILYASTHGAAPDCPPRPDFSHGYVWALYDSYEIYTARPDGTDVRRITDHPGYDAEATISEDGSKILFTSLRDGDVDLYTMKPDGSKVTRITREPGYDGGGFFSPDGKRIVYRASRPRTETELAEWSALLKDRLVRPTTLEIQIANADGSGARALTSLGAASFAPCWFRDGKRILFASNKADPKGRDFDLYMIRDDGSGLERVTYNDTFDGFPLFSRDGKHLVFASNRHAVRPGETNIFMADWVE